MLNIIQNTFLLIKVWKYKKLFQKWCTLETSRWWYYATLLVFRCTLSLDTRIFHDLYSEINYTQNYFWMILTSIPPSDHFRAEQQHRLILSIKAPLDQEDLFQPSNCTTQIKRGSNKYMQQKVAFFIMPPTFPNAGTLENAKTPWVPDIKEGTTTVFLCAKNTLLDSKGLVLFFWFTIECYHSRSFKLIQIEKKIELFIDFTTIILKIYKQHLPFVVYDRNQLDRNWKPKARCRSFFPKN